MVDQIHSKLRKKGKQTMLNRPNTLPVTELRAKLREVGPGQRRRKPILCWNCDKHPARDVHHLDDNHSNNVPSNLAAWCRGCHDDHHGITMHIVDLRLTARALAGIQQQRIGTENRLRGYVEVGRQLPTAEAYLHELEELEEAALDSVTTLVSSVPIYDLYLRKIKGVGPGIGGVLVGETGSSHRFQTISAYWSYCGLGVVNGAAPKRRKGEVANWQKRLRMTLCGRLADSFVRLADKGAMGRKLYDQYKAFYVQRDGEELTRAHIDRRARRKVVKVFLACLWVAWRQLDGLPVSDPYVADKLDHQHIYTPEDWVGSDWQFN
jgi:hypothetical protein